MGLVAGTPLWIGGGPSAVRRERHPSIDFTSSVNKRAVCGEQNRERSQSFMAASLSFFCCCFVSPSVQRSRSTNWCASFLRREQKQTPAVQSEISFRVHSECPLSAFLGRDGERRGLPSGGCSESVSLSRDVFAQSAAGFPVKYGRFRSNRVHPLRKKKMKLAR